MQRSNNRSGKVLAALLVAAVLIGTLVMTPTSVKASSSRSLKVSQGTTSLAKTARATAHSALAAFSSYTLKAVEIDGAHAHLNLLGDPLHPVLTFASTSIRGLQLSHPMGGNATLTITASGVSATGVALKTSIFSDLTTALGSFTNKADLLILIAGGTVRNLVMKNVNLKVDRYINANAMTYEGLQLSVS